MLKSLLKMKLIKIVCLFFVNGNLLLGQPLCKTENLLKEFLVSPVTYCIDTAIVDLTNVFKNNKVEYLGFIGNNKKRLWFNMTSVKLDSKDSSCYIVEGRTDVYLGSSRSFIGKMNVDINYRYLDILDKDIAYADAIKKQCFSILSYELKEDSNLSATGIFRGKVFVSWYLDEYGEVHYDDILNYIPQYSNCQFVGTWTSFKTGKSKIAVWGQYRILCSGDLDVGAAEFMPNRKYNNVGWGDYVP